MHIQVQTFFKGFAVDAIHGWYVCCCFLQQVCLIITDTCGSWFVNVMLHFSLPGKYVSVIGVTMTPCRIHTAQHLQTTGMSMQVAPCSFVFRLGLTLRSLGYSQGCDRGAGGLASGYSLCNVHIARHSCSGSSPVWGRRCRALELCANLESPSAEVCRCDNEMPRQTSQILLAVQVAPGHHVPFGPSAYVFIVGWLNTLAFINCVSPIAAEITSGLGYAASNSPRSKAHGIRDSKLVVPIVKVCMMLGQQPLKHLVAASPILGGGGPISSGFLEEGVQN